MAIWMRSRAVWEYLPESVRQAILAAYSKPFTATWEEAFGFLSEQEQRLVLIYQQAEEDDMGEFEAKPIPEEV